jgi:hypothetical protein
MATFKLTAQVVNEETGDHVFTLTLPRLEESQVIKPGFATPGLDDVAELIEAARGELATESARG